MKSVRHVVLIFNAYAACKSVMSGATVLVYSFKDGHNEAEMDANSNLRSTPPLPAPAAVVMRVLAVSVLLHNAHAVWLLLHELERLCRIYYMLRCRV